MINLTATSASRCSRLNSLPDYPDNLCPLLPNYHDNTLPDYREAEHYCRNGVREYLVWLVAEARVEWSCLEGVNSGP